MEWLASVLTSSNAIPIIIIAVLLIVIIAILAKKGIFSFNAFGLKIDNGNDERDIERTIIRSQIQYVKSAVSDFYDDIPDFEGRDEWRLRYICERIISVFTDIISFNHISKEKIYTEMKQASIWEVIINNTTASIMTSDEFKDVVYTKTAEILDKLISIREYYKMENKCGKKDY